MKSVLLALFSYTVKCYYLFWYWWAAVTQKMVCWKFEMCHIMCLFWVMEVQVDASVAPKGQRQHAPSKCLKMHYTTHGKISENYHFCKFLVCWNLQQANHHITLVSILLAVIRMFSWLLTSVPLWYHKHCGWLHHKQQNCSFNRTRFCQTQPW